MIKIKGTRIRIYPEELMMALHEAAEPRMKKALEYVADSARKSMKKAPAPGVPSRPGTPPNVQTGTLQRSIKPYVVKHGGWRIRGHVVGWSAKAWYGVVHEFGGRFHPIRAFLRPAYEKAKRRFKSYFRNMDLTKTKAYTKVIAKLRAQWYRR